MWHKFDFFFLKLWDVRFNTTSMQLCIKIFLSVFLRRVGANRRPQKREANIVEWKIEALLTEERN